MDYLLTYLCPSLPVEHRPSTTPSPPPPPPPPPPAIALCSGLLLSFQTSVSLAVSALLQCLASSCCEAGLSFSSLAGSRSGLGVLCWMLASWGCVRSSPTSSAVSAWPLVPVPLVLTDLHLGSSLAIGFGLLWWLLLESHLVLQPSHSSGSWWPSWSLPLRVCHSWWAVLSLWVGCLVVSQEWGGSAAPWSVLPIVSAVRWLLSEGSRSCPSLACLSAGTCPSASWSPGTSPLYHFMHANLSKPPLHAFDNAVCTCTTVCVTTFTGHFCPSHTTPPQTPACCIFTEVSAQIVC